MSNTIHGSLNKIGVKMEFICRELSQIVSRNSLNECAAEVSIVSDKFRFVHVVPFNYYFLNYMGKIIYILPPGQRQFQGGRRQMKNALLFENVNDFQYINTSWSESVCQSYKKILPTKKFVLFKQNVSYDIFIIINRMLEMGLFQLNIK